MVALCRYVGANLSLGCVHPSCGAVERDSVTWSVPTVVMRCTHCPILGLVGRDVEYKQGSRFWFVIN